MSDDYNGWRGGYCTWAVNLWMANDRGLYDAATEMAENEISTGELAALYKAWVCEDLAPDLGASFAADLLGYALDKVDWYEIATAWREDRAEATA